MHPHNFESNTVLTFLNNFGEAMTIMGRKFSQWIIACSWSKLLLIAFISLIFSSILKIGALVTAIIFGSVLIKIFYVDSTLNHAEGTQNETFN